MADRDRDEIEKFLDELRPDVVMIYPGSDGVEAVECLRGMCSKLRNGRVIVYTRQSDCAELINTALELGVSGYLLKDSALDELLHDIRRVWAGGAILAPAVASRLAEHFNQPGQMRSPAEGPDRQLTNREMQVLRYVARGKNNRAIAKLLFVCEVTVKFHVYSILEKLKAANRTEAALIAAQRGLVQLEPESRNRADSAANLLLMPTPKERQLPAGAGV